MKRIRLYRGQPVLSVEGDWLPTISRIGDRGAVALTFDDGPTPETTPRLLELLAGYDAPATFFVTGERASQSPDLVQAIVDGGHDIYAHAWSHVRLQGASPDVLADQMSRTEALLSRFRPTPLAYVVRLPYASGIRDAATHRAIAAWAPDAQLAAWTYATRDDQLPGEARDLDHLAELCDAEVERIMTRPRLGGAVLLTHEYGYDVDGPLNAPLAPMLMERLLPRLDRAGFAFERLRPYASPPALSRHLLSVTI